MNNYVPYPKNPKIASLFKEIGLVDELGSGLAKMRKYTKIYSGKEPTFMDDDVFISTIPINKIIANEKLDNKRLKEYILSFIANSDTLGRTRKEINDYIYPILNEDEKIMNNKVRTILTSLKADNLIKNIGSDKKPIWKIN